jgi:hypothetical protein
MDAQLAEIYGTGSSAEDDQVKLAAAELLVKLAEDNNVDLSQFSDAEVANMVSELQKTAEFPPKESKETAESKESKESSESGEKDAAEKVAEADFLGRVMAHSFNQELTEIQKQAGVVSDKVRNALFHAGEFAKKRGKDVSDAGKAVLDKVKGSRAMDLAKGDTLNKFKNSPVALADHAAKSHGGVATGANMKSELNKERAKVWGTRTGIAAGAGAAGVGVSKAVGGKKKESSALDALASERAWELAKEAGWVDTEGNLAPPQVDETPEEKTASTLEIEIERRALQMLEAEGVPVQWNE